jgi:hypothetical protein
MSPIPSHCPQLVILDANIVIEAFALNVWGNLVPKYSITLLNSVVGEVDFYEDSDGNKHAIDLTPWIASSQIKIENVSPQDVKDFIAQTDKSYYDRIHHGERDSLAFLFKNKNAYVITSSDNIVFKTLGRFNMGGKGLSFETMLKQIGLTKNLDLQFTEKFRIDCTGQGNTDFIHGFKA